MIADHSRQMGETRSNRMFLNYWKKITLNLKFYTQQKHPSKLKVKWTLLDKKQLEEFIISRTALEVKIETYSGRRKMIPMWKSGNRVWNK